MPPPWLAPVGIQRPIQLPSFWQIETSLRMQLARHRLSTAPALDWFSRHSDEEAALKARTRSVALVGAGLLSFALACDRKDPTSQPQTRAFSADREELQSEGEQQFRWDIISVDFATGTLSAGGLASATANDGSKITLTGSGTFDTDDKDDVSGGGTWMTFDPTGAATGNGTYEVRRLGRFTVAPGTPPLPHDNIGTLADNRAGLAFLRIDYSDGGHGFLVVSCHLVGTPGVVFEGITASKGFADYWNREAPPAPPGNADRTTFHVID